MAGEIESTIARLGLVLPPTPKPVANYVPFVVTGPLVFISGQITVGPNGLEYIGRVGEDFDIPTAQKAARLCTLNVIAQLRAACDSDLDRVKRCVRLGGFINAIPEFKDHSAVVNGASDLIAEVFGERGRHARTSLGVASLPFGVAVEIEALFEIA